MTAKEKATKVPKQKWDPDGEDAGLLFNLFQERIYHPDSYSAAGIYRTEELQPLGAAPRRRRILVLATTSSLVSLSTYPTAQSPRPGMVSMRIDCSGFPFLS